MSVGEKATLKEGAVVGNGSSLEAKATIGAGAQLGAQVSVGESATVKEGRWSVMDRPSERKPPSVPERSLARR
ncbi:hypothetical protein G3446_16605 [Thiorhodococcus minor]|uniref:UDP-3-O-(3-hydroxymyristoyl)glucosamine N-acyltransferase n=1 Tax=Thiorhodococcus minor TaxID=57489 RepID=A0A6M0K156_9GAMM|nr:hypothetical protein [Thiorhodococcus minor]